MTLAHNVRELWEVACYPHFILNERGEVELP